MTAIPAPTQGIRRPKDKDAKIFVASQGTLIWWRFRKHKLALASAIGLILIYSIVLFAEFFAPFPQEAYSVKYTYAPPQGLHFFLNGELKPHVLGYKSVLNQESLKRVFTIDPEQVIPIQFFA